MTARPGPDQPARHLIDWPAINLRVTDDRLIARAGFVFNRVFIYDPVSGTNGPAERIVFDPQIVLNTPPGLKDVPGLGAWTEVRPGQ